MELLVVTLAYIQPGRDVDAQTALGQVMDNIRGAVGLIAARSYRGRAHGLYYLLLTTWEDEESWYKAQERYDPRTNLLAYPELLLAPPEQWLMYYQWGYSRPSRSMNISTLHIATLQANQVDTVQQTWTHVLRQQSQTPTLAFAFLARGMDRDATIPRKAMKATPGSIAPEPPYQQGPILIGFLSWASESERETFYHSPSYRSLQKSIEQAGVTRILPLDQV